MEVIDYFADQYTCAGHYSPVKGLIFTKPTFFSLLITTDISRGREIVDNLRVDVLSLHLIVSSSHHRFVDCRQDMKLAA